MGHNIRGIVAPLADAPVVAAALGVGDVALPDGGFAFIPLGDDAFDALAVSPSDALPGFVWLTPAVEAALARAHAAPAFAWIEIDYFGGVGTQAAALYRMGRREWAAAASGGVVNRTLAALGVCASAGQDAFDAVGLGRFRGMDSF